MAGGFTELGKALNESLSQEGLAYLGMGSLESLGRSELTHKPSPPMLDLAPTEEIEREYQAALARAGKGAPIVIQQKRLLDRAKLRDQLVQERRAMGSEYQSCWCLGLGGRDQYTMGVRTDAGALAPMVKLPDGETVIGPFVGHREYCSCPEGTALAQRETVQHHELGAAYRSLSKHRRAQHARIPSHYDGLDLHTWADATTSGNVGPSADAAVIIANDVGNWLHDMLLGRTDEPHLLFMAGGYGNGKTGLAAYIGRSFLDKGMSVTMRKVAEILAELRAAPWRSRGTDDEDRPLTEHELVLRATRDDLLILDDLGAEALVGAQADRAVEALTLIIDGRLSNGKPTVITTNEPGDVLKQRIGERLLDRLIGGRTSKLILFNAIPSLRRSTW